MTEPTELTRYTRLGIAAIVVGVVVSIVGALWAHFTGLPPTSNLGVELYPAFPRHWVWVTLGQIVSLSGAMIAMGGLALATLYQRPVTWARAAIGAGLFTGLMMILFGIVPNEWLTLTQATLEWTPQKTLFTIPPWLILGNDLSISAAVVKDAIAGTYTVALVGAVAVGMYKWQERAKKAASAPPPQPVSVYGRPLSRVDR